MDNHLRIATASILWAGLLGFDPSASGQSDEVLTARTAKNTVFIDVDPEIRDIRLLENQADVDNVLWEYATRDPDPLVLVKDNAFNLRMRVKNPLSYNVTVRGQEFTPDPYDEALRNVADNLQQIVNVVSRGAISVQSVAEKDLLSLLDAAGKDGKGISAQPYRLDLALARPEDAVAGTSDIRDYGLRRAIMLYAIVDAGNTIDTANAGRSQLAKIVRKAKAVEDFAAQNMLAEATSVIKSLMLIDLSTAEAKENITELGTLVKNLEKANNQMSDSLKALTEMRVTKSDEQNYWELMAKLMDEKDPEVERINISLRFVQLSLEEFIDRMVKLIAQRQMLVVNLNNLMGIVQRTYASITSTEHGTDRIYESNIPSGLVEKVTVFVTKREISVGADYSIKVKESDLLTRNIRFMRAHTFYPQLFPAVVFINAIYPEFVATEDEQGIQRVRAKDNPQGYLNLAGMTNFNFKLGRKTEVPFLQLGASAKKSQPQVFIGGGIRFSEWLGVSAGMCVTWQGSLDELEEGDQVTGQDVIDNDLRYTMSDPSFYFAVQLRPSAVTKKAN